MKFSLNAFTKKNKPIVHSDLRKLKPVFPEVDNYIHQVEELPEWLKGKKYNYKEYTIDPYNLNCNCEDAIERAKVYKDRDVRRCCRHLYFHFINHESGKTLNSLTKFLMNSTAIYGELLHFTRNIYQVKVVYGFDKDTDWVNVFAPVKGTDNYVRYSYNPIENKWSYGNEPYKAVWIEDQLFKIIRNELPYEHKLIKIKPEK